MDFPKLDSTKKAPALAKPIKIFETLPSLPGTFNDLWRGQDIYLTGASTDDQDFIASARQNLPPDRRNL